MCVDEEIRAFEISWIISGRARKTISEYKRYLKKYFDSVHEVSLSATSSWLLSIKGAPSRRIAARAIRSFGKYLETMGNDRLRWWRYLPLAQESIAPHETVKVENIRDARKSRLSSRDHAIVELLWSSGLRRSEVAGLNVSDVQFETQLIVVRASKSNDVRYVPLSPDARSALNVYLAGRVSGSVFQLSPAGISAMLRRRGLPPAHAWRRGWAVESLRRGISETSVRTAAGWRSGSMVVRYTAALSQELAIAEFQRSWADEV